MRGHIDNAVNLVALNSKNELVTFELLFEILCAVYGTAKRRLNKVMRSLESKERGWGECPICFEDIEFKGSAHTDCHHYFHRECIKNELQVRKRCPLCNQPVAQLFFTKLAS